MIMFVHHFKYLKVHGTFHYEEDAKIGEMPRESESRISMLCRVDHFIKVIQKKGPAVKTRCFARVLPNVEAP